MGVVRFPLLNYKSRYGKHRPPHKRHYIATSIAYGGSVVRSFGYIQKQAGAALSIARVFLFLGVLSRRRGFIDSTPGGGNGGGAAWGREWLEYPKKIKKAFLHEKMLTRLNVYAIL